MNHIGLKAHTHFFLAESCTSFLLLRKHRIPAIRSAVLVGMCVIVLVVVDSRKNASSLDAAIIGSAWHLRTEWILESEKTALLDPGRSAMERFPDGAICGMCPDALQSSD